jgi:hypothetical protein
VLLLDQRRIVGFRTEINCAEVVEHGRVSNFVPRS